VAWSISRTAELTSLMADACWSLSRADALHLVWSKRFLDCPLLGDHLFARAATGELPLGVDLLYVEFVGVRGVALERLH
jgi:hypothetical protein